MPDLSTEPKMMRSQQDKDTPENLSEDETRNTEARKDSDRESGKDREESKAGIARYETEQQTAIFEGNKRGEGDVLGDGEEATAEENAGDPKTGMASKGRSRL
ncbi:hypothetical protein FP2506_07231 [Fulvimarina pelagi HTCC2506]|uniref:Uncharacterized protein n=1 Tax=Fulvimarina pelagi HTCC2506 TaxID=314231 RepID=Q0G6V0_9HYPH|nr:hypothetical protein [Fulvimarina pelagi]EAU42614.1 hypothetical protein FP2506_07231 [Fulvimarina pelagi HTCC2506]